MKKREPSSVRPLTSRVRSALFSILGDKVKGKKVLDLFAGLGTFGLEALKRGAQSVTFVDINSCMVRRIEGELKKKQWEERSQVLRGDVSRIIPLLAKRKETFDLIFIDPPYGKGLSKKVLSLPSLKEILLPSSLIILREFWRETTPPPEGFLLLQRRKYGEMVVSFLSLRNSF